MPSPQAGAAQTPPVQTKLLQSMPAPQVCPGPQALQVGPPQSTSLSRPFFTPSMHVAGTHWLDWQTPVPQSVPVTHSTHVPWPSQTLPPPALHVVPGGDGLLTGLPAAQLSSVQ